MKKYLYYKCPKCNNRTIPYVQINIFSPKICPDCKINLIPKNFGSIFKRQLFILSLLFILLKTYFFITDYLVKSMTIDIGTYHLLNLILGSLLMFLYSIATIISDTQMTELKEFKEW
jgi:hypothetical protein